ncbi:DUF4255 domain-containing protein [Xenorhabdus bovienii]|uniref:DUF4255 domain-containing protein n=1 Tax=Xenorhabdus bovienii TaxID=40576 RepID=UPI0023B22A0F|nr:DUF4255 domain-containing protein [Xenorhabdus bovienii]MDE9429180.1 DUF4255 domain-containing protein [Xenorhabdus bovienii]MDE9435275.1 DUF4255 domain-containing protein [Xenorhabdus bovienii]MDE9497083.1 DUF4255 domain-containing protein [Xenorhabdus bovienii]
MLETKTIIDVNNAMNDMLRKYLNREIDIRFDLPEINTVPSKATVSVFLYDIHEDLQLRSAESRGFNASAGKLLPGWINVKCNYLITYWESSSPKSDASNPDSQPCNQAICVMSQVLEALINNRQLTGIPGAYTKIIPQQENLNSLGNFWQALGNRPRLSLNYSVTVPISLKVDEDKDKAIKVTDVSSRVEQTTSLSQETISHALREQLITELGKKDDIRLALRKVKISTTPANIVQKDLKRMDISLSVSGIIPKEYRKKIDEILSDWKGNDKIIITINDCNIYIKETKTESLFGI